MEKTFDPKLLNASRPHWATYWCEGPVTRVTDPMKRGWRCRPAFKGSEDYCYIIGRPGIGGCASVIAMSRGTLDVAIYEDTPKEISSIISNGGREADAYREIDDIPGWGFKVIQLIQKLCQ